MKNYLNQLLVITALIIVGCSDPCDDVVCGPGTCDDGTCICPAGYEGDSCETLENEKYFGVYNITTSQCADGAEFDATTMTVSANADGGAFDVTISVTGPTESLMLDGILNNGGLEVSQSIAGFLITFDGDFTDVNTFAGNNSIDTPFGKVDCTFSASR